MFKTAKIRYTYNLLVICGHILEMLLIFVVFLVQFAEITIMTGQSVSVATPDYLFAVTYPDYTNKKFSELRGDRRVFYAYHGSRLENFHSILHYGLQGHLNKVRVSYNVDEGICVNC